ncbi:hypothetical protein VaNZ11_012297 [Volvox africanus]|uniref:Guanylate cyclase domain-containing protein n=1 Tax=Volvox africanus TaxID=51714 RepID=A0ABQ5SDF5_9CHLO|nr:hypothetical protein VaNZ11_012297 [Volvox africanus]
MRTLHDRDELCNLHKSQNVNYRNCLELQPQPSQSSPSAAASGGINASAGDNQGSPLRRSEVPHWQPPRMTPGVQVAPLDVSTSVVGCAGGADSQDSSVQAGGGGGGRSVESYSCGRRRNHDKTSYGLAAVGAATLHERSFSDKRAASRDRMGTDGAAQIRGSRSLDVSTRLPRQESISEPSMCPGLSGLRPAVILGGAAAATAAFPQPAGQDTLTRSARLGTVASSPFLRSPVAASRSGGAGSCHSGNTLQPPLQKQHQYPYSGSTTAPQQRHSFHAGSELADAAEARRGGGGSACYPGEGCRTGAAAGRRTGAGLLDVSAHGDTRGPSAALSRMAPARGGGGGGGAMDDTSWRSPVHGPGYHPGSGSAVAHHAGSSHHHCQNHHRLTNSQPQQQQRQQQQSALQLQLRRAFHLGAGTGSGRWSGTGPARHASWCGSCGGSLSATSTGTGTGTGASCGQKVTHYSAASDGDGSGGQGVGGGGGGSGGSDLQGCLQLGSLVSSPLKQLPSRRLLPSLRRDLGEEGRPGQASPRVVRPQNESVLAESVSVGFEVGQGKLLPPNNGYAPTDIAGDGVPQRVSAEAAEGLSVAKMDIGGLRAQLHGCDKPHQHVHQVPGTSLLAITWNARSTQQNDGSPGETCIGSVEAAEATFMWYSNGSRRGAEDSAASGKTGSRHRAMSATSLSAAAGALSAAPLPDMAAAAAERSVGIGDVAGVGGTQSTRPGSEGSAIPWAFPQQRQVGSFAVNSPPTLQPVAVPPASAPPHLPAPQQTQPLQSPSMTSVTPSSLAMDGGGGGGGGGGPWSQTCDGMLLFQSHQEQLWQALSTSTWGTMVGGRARNRSSCTGGGSARRNTSYMEGRSVRCGTAYSGGGAPPPRLLHQHSSITSEGRSVCGGNVNGGGGGLFSCTLPDGSGPRPAVGAPQVCRSVHFPMTHRAGPDLGSAGLLPYSAAPTRAISKAALSNGPFDAGFTREGGSRIAGQSSPANILVGSGGGGCGDPAPAIGSSGDGRKCGKGGGCELTGSDGQLWMHTQRSSQVSPTLPPPPSSETVLNLLAETLPALHRINARRNGAPKALPPQPQAHSPASNQEDGPTAAAMEAMTADDDPSSRRSPGAKRSANCHSVLKRHPYGPFDMAPLSEDDDGDGGATLAAAAETAGSGVAAAEATTGFSMASKLTPDCASPPVAQAPGAGLAVPRIVQLTMRSMARAVSAAGAMQRSPYSNLGSPGGSSHCTADTSVRGGALVPTYGNIPMCEYGSAAVTAVVMEAADPSEHGATCIGVGTAPSVFRLHGSNTPGIQNRPFGSAVLPGISNDGSLVRGDGGLGSCGGGGGVSVTAAAMAAAAASVDSRRQQCREGAQFQSSPWILDSNHDVIGEWTQVTDRACPVMSTTGGATAAAEAPYFDDFAHPMSSAATTAAAAAVQAAAAAAGDIEGLMKLKPSAPPAANGCSAMNVEGGRWFEVVVSGIPHPATGEILLLVVQHDISSRVWAEKHLARVMEAEHLLLESIFPQHVLEHIAVMAATSALQGEDGLQGALVRDSQPASSLPPSAQWQAGPEGQPQPQQQAWAAESGQGAGTGHAHGAGLSLVRRSMHGMRPPAGSQAVPITGDTFLHLATSHSALTVLFCDIQGFTTMCNSVKPATVMSFLNDLYTRLDAMLDAFGVYKVETIGDCYMVAGGLMKVDEETGAVTVRSDDVDPQHAHRTVQFAKALLHAASAVRLPSTGEPVRLRVGIHSGPAMSGVVGTRMPRFCLFGDTINTASRMESTGMPGAIHVSQATRDLTPNEPWEPTGGVEAKGKGRLTTYLLRPQHNRLNTQGIVKASHAP